MTAFGILLIPLFDSFDSVFEAISYVTSIVVPPLMIVIVFGLVTKKFNAFCAKWTLILGSLALFVSIVFPEVVVPFSHGIPMSAVKPFKYIRSFYGVATSFIIALSLYFYSCKKEHS